MVRQSRLRWVYFLPILHLCACFISLASYVVPRFEYAGGTLWEVITMLDLPLSLVAIGLAWKHGVLATIWIMVVGTLWWYLLGRGAEVVFDLMRRPKPVALFPPTEVKTNRDTSRTDVR